ncbi:mitochondrial carrier domain-containing protein [Cladochytrium replicatum]|nr:mitochondrial carrier domain-containing protein [Cladochytrium replicatum]
MMDHKELLAGTLGGFAQVIVGHPFDTIKVRMQTHSDFKGPIDCLKKTIALEGPSALYKGVTSPLTGVGFCNAILFSVNGNIRRALAGPSGDPQKLSIGQYTLGGALTGGVIAFVACPIELLKVKLQTQYSNSGGGLIKVAVNTVRTNGFSGLYRGITATVLRDIPSFAAYFGTYEYLKNVLSRNSTHELQPTDLLLAGGTSGIACWIPCYMQDVVKSRIQSDVAIRSISTLEYAKEVYQSLGFSGFFRGFAPTMLRAFPANAATFVAYEFAMKALG